jgi:hypothetical protein
MRLFVLTAFLLAVSCGVESDSTSGLAEQIDYTKTASGLLEDEEMVITFVGMRKGLLVDKSLMSIFDTDLEVYMNVSLLYRTMTYNPLSADDVDVTIEKYGNTEQLPIPMSSRADTQHMSGEQIIVSASQLNRTLALDDSGEDLMLSVKFYENGAWSDNDADILSRTNFYGKYKQTSSYFHDDLNIVEAHNLKEYITKNREYRKSLKSASNNELEQEIPPPPSKLTFYLNAYDKTDNMSEIEYTIEIRKVQLEQVTQAEKPDSNSYKVK